MKIGLAGCSGMSPNGLISRATVYKTNKENKNTISICMGATSGGNENLNKLIKKHPIIGINRCEQKCVDKILKEKGIKVNKTININKELEKENIKAENIIELNENDKKCVKIIQKQIEIKMEEIEND